MSKSLRSSLLRHLDPDLRKVGNPLRAISLQQKRNRERGLSDPEVFSYAQRARHVRTLHREIARESKPSFLRDIPESHKLRVFIHDSDYQRLGPQRRKLLGKLARGCSSATDLGSSPHITFSVGEYFSFLSRNSHLPDFIRGNLIKLQNGTTSCGPGLGSMNERRAALALSILKDRGLIVGFQICGEAGKPLMSKSNSASLDESSSLDYSAHEEAMAVDILVQLQSKPSNIYLPLQIKSSGSEGYDRTQRYLTFNAEEKARLQEVMPRMRELFVEDHRRRGKFRLKFQRQVLKMGLNARKIVKSHKKDFELDIANKIMAMIEYARGKGETLLLRNPYTKYSYVDKVIAMIQSGFLIPVIDLSNELDF